MKILITGATGFVGSNLVCTLVQKRENIICLLHKKGVNLPFDSKKVEIRIADICDKKSVIDALRGVDIVYHLAAISGKSAITEKLYQKVNVGGLHNIIDASLINKIKKLVFVSSAAVTGSLDTVPGDEESPIKPTNGYERSKVDGERLILDAISKRKLPAMIIRPGSIYGPGNNKSNMFNFLKMATKGFFVMPGDGENCWDMIYISDCIDGLILAGQTKITGETIILTGPKPVKVNKIIAVAAEANGKECKILHIPVLPMKIMGKAFGLVETSFGVSMPFSDKTIQILSGNRYHSHAKAKMILGFNPKVNIQTGIAQTIAWYKEKELI